jgi:2-oxoglutarate ferredoxin oxidoreductase subunit gamma
MLKEVRVAGFGGQGIILAASIIGKTAALYENGYATMTQNYGPEARGGASSAQLVISDEPILYPYTTQPDVLIALSQEAFDRFGAEAKPGGLIIVEEDLVRVSGLPAESCVLGVAATRLAEELGKRITLNIVTIGFFAAATGLLKRESYEQAIADSVPHSSIALNLAAFSKGWQAAEACAPVRTV